MTVTRSQHEAWGHFHHSTPLTFCLVLKPPPKVHNSLRQPSTGWRTMFSWMSCHLHWGCSKVISHTQREQLQPTFCSQKPSHNTLYQNLNTQTVSERCITKFTTKYFYMSFNLFWKWPIQAIFLKNIVHLKKNAGGIWNEISWKMCK